MVEIKTIENIERIDWKELLAHSATSTYFQSPEYYDFFNSLSFLKTFGWGVFRNGELKALICGYIIGNGGKLKQFFSRRAIIHGGLLLADDVRDHEIDELLQKTIDSLSKQVIYIEIRNSLDFNNYKHIFERKDFRYLPHLNYIINTKRGEEVKDRYSESKIRQIRKARAQDVVCELAVDSKNIDDFYNILQDLYKHKVRKPLFPKEFFEKLVLQDNCRLFVVKKEEKVIGGIACAFLSGKTVYEWFVCGDTIKFKHLYPSVVATHKGIEFAAENGFEYFDFMGAGKPNVDYGVREFKERFGGELVEWGRFLFVCNPFLYKMGKLAVNIRKRL